MYKIRHIHTILVSTHCDSNALIPTILGGGTAYDVTLIIIDRYRAFQRCLRASLEGSFVSLYINQEVK